MNNQKNIKQYMMQSHVLVSSGCYNEIPHTRRLKQWKFLSQGSEGWEVQDQGSHQFRLVRALFSSILDDHLLTVSSHDLLFILAWRKTSLVFLLLRALNFSDQHPTLTIPFYPNISQNPHLQIPSHSGLGLQHTHLGKDTNIQSITSLNDEFSQTM